MEIFIVGIGGSGPRAGKDSAARMGMNWVSRNLPFNDVWQVQSNLADELKRAYANKHNLNVDDLYNTNKKEIHRPGLISYGAEKRRENRSYWPMKLASNFCKTILDQEMKQRYAFLFVPDCRYGQELNLPVFVYQNLIPFYPQLRVRFHSLYIEVPVEILRKRSGIVDDNKFMAIMHDASETCLGPEDFGVTIHNDTSLSEFEERCEPVFANWFKRLVVKKNAAIEKEG